MKLETKPSTMQVLAFIEQRYYETNLLPTKEAVCEQFNIDLRTFAGIARRTEFVNAFKARGLPSYETVRKNDKGLLTPIQLAVANILLNTHDRNTIRKKLTALNVSSAQFQAWQKQAAFMDYLRNESIARFNNADVDARVNLVKLVQDSDLQAIKYYFELSGVYSPNAQPILDLSRILASVLEILVKYLAPGELLEVANQLESALNGELRPVEPKFIETHEVTNSGAVGIGFDEFVDLMEGQDDTVPSDEHNPGPERDSAQGREGYNFTLPGLRI